MTGASHGKKLKLSNLTLPLRVEYNGWFLIQSFPPFHHFLLITFELLLMSSKSMTIYSTHHFLLITFEFLLMSSKSLTIYSTLISPNSRTHIVKNWKNNPMVQGKPIKDICNGGARKKSLGEPLK